MKTAFLGISLLFGAAVILSACGGSDGSTAACSLISVDGQPDMTGAPSFDVSSVDNVSGSVTITVPIDADVARINLNMISTSGAMGYLEPVVQEAILTPGAQDWQYVISTAGYTPGTYFADIELCTDSTTCLNSGIIVGYTDISLHGDSENYMRVLSYNNGPVVSPVYEDSCIKKPSITVTN